MAEPLPEHIISTIVLYYIYFFEKNMHFCHLQVMLDLSNYWKLNIVKYILPI